MLDGYLLFEEHSTKRTKNTQKCQKLREVQYNFQFSDHHSKIKKFM